MVDCRPHSNETPVLDSSHLDVHSAHEVPMWNHPYLADYAYHSGYHRPRSVHIGYITRDGARRPASIQRFRASREPPTKPRARPTPKMDKIRRVYVEIAWRWCQFRTILHMLPAHPTRNLLISTLPPTTDVLNAHASVEMMWICMFVCTQYQAHHAVFAHNLRKYATFSPLWHFSSHLTSQHAEQSKPEILWQQLGCLVRTDPACVVDTGCKGQAQQGGTRSTLQDRVYHEVQLRW